MIYHFYLTISGFFNERFRIDIDRLFVVKGHLLLKGGDISTHSRGLKYNDKFSVTECNHNKPRTNLITDVVAYRLQIMFTQNVAVKHADQHRRACFS
jgi:hypothetical protein